MAPSKKPSQENFITLSGLAQELDGPLRSMAKSTRKLIDEYKQRDFEYISYKDFSKIFAILEQVNRQLNRCSQATGRLLTLNTSDPKNSLVCDINEVILENVGLLKQQMSATKIKPSLRLSKGLPLVRLGKVECHQVIHNVLVNAMQSMPAGGVLKIATALDKGNKTVALDVQDEGVGITPEHLSKVFEPFFTTHERGFEKSAGLGLFIAHFIMEKAGGSIHIKSSLRKGTLVQIDLPLAVSSKTR